MHHFCFEIINTLMPKREVFAQPTRSNTVVPCLPWRTWGAHTRHSHHLSWARQPCRSPRLVAKGGQTPPFGSSRSLAAGAKTVGVLSDGGGGSSRLAYYTKEIISGKGKQTVVSKQKKKDSGLFPGVGGVGPLCIGVIASDLEFLHPNWGFRI
jgi:hypothetical protein